MRPKPTRKVVVTAVVLIALVAGGGFYLKQRADKQAEEEARVEKANALLVNARDECNDVGTIGDEGFTWSIDTEGTDDATGDSLEDFLCALDELDTPDAVVNHVESTRSLDGRQTDEWDRIEAAWTYHPDNGINIVFELEPETAKE